jgi:hypothetical protein
LLTSQSLRCASTTDAERSRAQQPAARPQLLVSPGDDRLVLPAQDVQRPGGVHAQLAAAHGGRRGLLGQVPDAVEALDGLQLLRGQVDVTARMPVGCSRDEDVRSLDRGVRERHARPQRQKTPLAGAAASDHRPGPTAGRSTGTAA